MLRPVHREWMQVARLASPLLGGSEYTGCGLLSRDSVQLFAKGSETSETSETNAKDRPRPSPMRILYPRWEP